MKGKKIKKIGGRLGKNGNICLFSSKADIEIIMQFCNMLADKIDELVEVVNEREETNENTL